MKARIVLPALPVYPYIIELAHPCGVHDGEYGFKKLFASEQKQNAENDTLREAKNTCKKCKVKLGDDGAKIR
jgi:hypothetical protein